MWAAPFEVAQFLMGHLQFAELSLLSSIWFLSLLSLALSLSLFIFFLYTTLSGAIWTPDLIFRVACTAERTVFSKSWVTPAHLALKEKLVSLRQIHQGSPNPNDE